MTSPLEGVSVLNLAHLLKHLVNLLARHFPQTVSGGEDGSIMAGPDGTSVPRPDGGKVGDYCAGVNLGG